MSVYLGFGDSGEDKNTRQTLYYTIFSRHFAWQFGSPVLQSKRLKINHVSAQKVMLVFEWERCGILSLHVTSIDFCPAVFWQREDYHFAYSKHRQSFHSSIFIVGGNALKEMPSLSRGFDKCPFIPGQHKGPPVLWDWQLLLQGQSGEATFSKLPCTSSFTSSGSTVINETN